MNSYESPIVSSPNPYQASVVKRQTGTLHGGGAAPARRQVKRRLR